MHQGFRSVLVLSLLATFIVFTPAAVHAATLTVTTTADSGPGSLRQAVLDASPGDTIDFDIAGEGPHTVTLTSGQILINKDLTLDGRGANDLTVSGSNNSRIFWIANGATATIDGLTISNGQDDRGGGIFNQGNLTITSSTITSSTISGNSPINVGGGIFNAGMLTVTSSTISGNSTTNFGGGIFNQGTLTITSSTISGNSATNGGGMVNLGMLTVTSSTISGNSATNNGGGIANGGIFDPGTLIIASSTISGNSAPNGGGIFNQNTLTITISSSSIVAGNTGDNVNGPITSTNSLTSGDPKLGDLADNGGPTWTMLPQPDSPAINAGGETCPDVDQRGVNRPQGTACDIGAIEVRLPVLDLPDDIVTTATSPAGAPVTFTVTATDWEGNDTSVSCDAETGDVFPLDETTVICSTSGEVDHDVSESFTISVNLPVAPTITVPDDMTVEATSPAGAVVTFAPTATDWNNEPLTVTCVPASGSTFSLGETTVDCSATDAFDRTAEDSFTVTVLVPGQPALTVPQNITVLATSQSGAAVEFSTSASDVHGTALDVECNRVSGQTFPIETTTVTCSAEDGYGQFVQSSFTVTVVIPTGPTINLPDEVIVETENPDGAPVTWGATASDYYDNDLSVTCNRESGAHYAVGSYRVTCSATDMFGQEVSGSFTIEVVYVGEMIPPRISPVINTRIPATGPDGTVVVYNLSVWSPIDPNPLVVCTPPSGSLFPIGTTTVTCTATDRFGNTSSVTFTITIFVPQEQEPGPSPGLTLPDGMTVNATSPSGALVSYAVGASAGATVICNPAPGATLPIGTTTVTCTATGGDGQQTNGSFEVRVLGAMAQLRTLIAAVVTEDEDAAVPLILAAIGLNRGFDELSCRQLDLFIAAAGETAWVADARRIRNVIGCDV